MKREKSREREQTKDRFEYDCNPEYDCDFSRVLIMPNAEPTKIESNEDCRTYIKQKLVDKITSQPLSILTAIRGLSEITDMTLKDLFEFDLNLVVDYLKFCGLNSFGKLRFSHFKFLMLYWLI